MRDNMLSVATNTQDKPDKNMIVTKWRVMTSPRQRVDTMLILMSKPFSSLSE